MIPAPIHLTGERLMLDPAGALYWPAERLLAVSDLHLEKGSSYAPRGMLLPPFDTKSTIDRLVRLIRQWNPTIVVALGDSFHDNEAVGRLHSDQADRLRRIVEARQFVWVQGNHDPAPHQSLGGECTDTFTLGSLAFRHQAKHSGTGEISGHFHPKASVPARGGYVSRPCFVADPRRIVMPAFGAYTGGLDVSDAAIARLFPRGGRVFLLGRDRLFSFGLSGSGGKGPLSREEPEISPRGSYPYRSD